MTTNTTPVLQEVRRLAEEIRVQLHLGGMEAKDAWAKLQPKLQAFEQRFERATEDAGDDLDELAAVLRKELQRVKDRLRKA
jgi:ElaB/YqjD/DUF883 family membrane-anchored ribosome-binding protein